MKAVAWQESCWRQFVRTRTGIVPIQSSTGDFGMMQINVRVWRGFFNPVKLRWSAGYNAGAGTEILWQLLGRYGVREGRERLSNAARSSYSAYHGGPRRYRRYRSADAPPEMRLIDQAFWEKFQLVSAGNAGDRVLCMPVRALPDVARAVPRPSRAGTRLQRSACKHLHARACNRLQTALCPDVEVTHKMPP